MSATKEHYHDQIEAGQRGKQHKISWLNMPGYKPETWNPIVGCSKVSPGCDNCYAEKMAIRLSAMPDKQVSSDYKLTMLPNADNKPSGWNGHTIFRHEYLLRPRHWKTPRMVFVCSMSDLFHEYNTWFQIEQVLDVAAQYEGKHIFIILTKRPERMVQYFKEHSLNYGLNKPISNVWIGVTAENQEQANKRIPILLSIPAAKHFVSIEPMLGPVDLINLENGNSDAFNHSNGRLDWVICGGESGNRARPMHPDWVRSVRHQCASANVPFFFKQWGEWGEVPDYGSQKGKICFNSDGHHQWIPSVKGYSTMKKVGRKAAGDLLDGVQHHNWPKL